MKRFYEWRYVNGKRFGEPTLAENACAFRMQQRRDAVVNEGAPGAPPTETTVEIYVALTGEKVLVLLNASYTACRLIDEPALPWFNAEGREVKP